MSDNNRFKQLVDRAKQHVNEVTVDHVAQLLQSGQAPLIIDVRETAEFVANHIPGAKHLSRGILEVHIDKLLEDVNAPVILYCGGGSRSALAALSLQQMGYTQVTSMAGGYRGWVAAGCEVVAGDTH